MFRFIILILPVICSPFYSLGQTNTFTDSRDGSTYQLVELNGKLWFGENLRLITPGSFFQSVEEAEAHGGNYYPYHEQPNLCPKGWKIASVDDWGDYFEYLIDVMDKNIEVKRTFKETGRKKYYSYYIEDDVSIMEHDILNVEGTFGVEKNKILKFGPTFWSVNPHLEDLKFHAHFGIKGLAIHTHKHHITARWQKKRRFAVRCVCEIKE